MPKLEAGTKIGMYGGHTVYVDDEGTFYARVQEKPHKKLSSVRLTDLHRAIDRWEREQRRAEAATTRVRAFYRRDRFSSRTHDDWVAGVFVRLNGVTGAVTIRADDGREQEVSSYAILFPDDDKVQEAIEAARAQVVAADAAVEVAQKAYDAAVEHYGHRVQLGYGRADTRRAAEAEAALVAFLEKPR